MAGTSLSPVSAANSAAGLGYASRYGVRFVPRPGLETRMVTSGILLIPLEAVSKAIATNARDIAPVETGAYRSGIVGMAGFADGVTRGRVVAKDFKSGWIEFGTWKWPAHAVLRRACDSLGLKVRGRIRYRWRPASRGGWY